MNLDQLQDNNFSLDKIETKLELASLLEELASYDFDKFIFLLYKHDIEEDKVKLAFAENPNPFEDIADKIFEKLNQKKQNRTAFTYPDIEDNEKW